METRLASEYFEPLMDFPAFVVQKLWPKKNKINNQLWDKLPNLLFLGHNFWTQDHSKTSKVLKDLSILA